MGAFTKRMDAKLAVYGELISLGGVDVRALVQDMTSSYITTYFDPPDQSSVIRPGLLAVVGADVSASAGQSVSLGARTYTVWKVAPQHLAGQVVCQVLALY
ncbi:MAG: hypothetical protein IT209_03165 [Armatimonadetes bacterium]|nr:hypothetical protein [Armatimonadota bacterium]